MFDHHVEVRLGVAGAACAEARWSFRGCHHGAPLRVRVRVKVKVRCSQDEACRIRIRVREADYLLNWHPI